MPDEGVTTFTADKILANTTDCKGGLTNLGAISRFCNVGDGGWWYHRWSVSGASFVDGQYVAVEVLFKNTTANGYFKMWGAKVVGIYEKATGKKVDAPELNKVYLYVCELDDTLSGEWTYKGQFAAYADGSKGMVAYFGNVHIFDNATLFNNWIGA